MLRKGIRKGLRVGKRKPYTTPRKPQEYKDLMDAEADMDEVLKYAGDVKGYTDCVKGSEAYTSFNAEIDAQLEDKEEKFENLSAKMSDLQETLKELKGRRKKRNAGGSEKDYCRI